MPAVDSRKNQTPPRFQGGTKTDLDWLKVCQKAFPNIEATRKKQVSEENPWVDTVFLEEKSHHGLIVKHTPDTLVSEAGVQNTLVGISTWGYSRNIYRFHPEVYQELMTHPYDKKLPSDLLLRLPNFSCYVETPGLLGTFQNIGEFPVRGFYVCTGYRAATQVYLLKIVFCSPDGWYNNVTLEVGEGLTITQSVERNADYIRDTANASAAIYQTTHVVALTETVKKIMPLILYLCAEKPEFQTSKLAMKKNPCAYDKKGFRLFRPKSSKLIKTGFETGAKIAGYHQSPDQSNRKKMKAHLRSAHWHSYWIGQRGSNKRNLIIKWIPPTPVNVS